MQELLFLSSLAKFEPPTAIRGGIPVCWPQFGDMGPVKQQHGFARNLAWQVGIYLRVSRYPGYVWGQQRCGTDPSTANVSWFGPS